MTKKLLATSLLACAASAAFAKASTNTVSDVTALTNALRTAGSPKTIYLEKGTYDVKDCTSEICSGGNLTAGRLAFPNGETVILSGAPGTKRGDVIITSSVAGRRLLQMNKGTLTITNVTMTGQGLVGGIQVSNGDSRLYFYDSVFSNLTANSAAVMARYYAKADSTNSDVFRNCLFADNRATSGSVGTHNFRGGIAYDCVYTNNSCTVSGGAVSGGSFVRCTFVDNYTSSRSTSAGGGAIGVDYDNHIGFCTDCTFIGNKLTGGYGAHGAAVHKATALTNCVFKGNDAYSNSIVADCGEIVGCTFENNLSSNVIVETVSSFQRCVFSGNRPQGRLVRDSSRFVNSLFTTNRCAVASGIVNGSLVNCTLVGNYCNSGNVSDSIVSADSKAINCLFYQNRAHNTTYLDMALRFTKNDLVTALSPYMTNCLWTADTTYNQTHKEAALARTQASQQMDADKYRFVGTGDHPYALIGGAAARYAGFLDDEVRDAVGETDLAGNPRLDGGRITLGCYQRKTPGLQLLVR